MIHINKYVSLIIRPLRKGGGGLRGPGGIGDFVSIWSVSILPRRFDSGVKPVFVRGWRDYEPNCPATPLKPVVKSCKCAYFRPQTGQIHRMGSRFKGRRARNGVHWAGPGHEPRQIARNRRESGLAGADEDVFPVPGVQLGDQNVPICAVTAHWLQMLHAFQGGVPWKPVLGARAAARRTAWSPAVTVRSSSDERMKRGKTKKYPFLLSMATVLLRKAPPGYLFSPKFSGPSFF